MRNWVFLKFSLDGDQTLSRALVNVGDKLKDFRKPLQETGRLILQDIRVNFDTEGGLVGGWAPLKEKTIRQRLREGFGAGPILQRTGRYKRAFKGVISTKKLIIDAFGVRYHKYHQSILPRTKLPRRPTLFLRNETKAEIVRQFQEYIRFNL